MKKIRVIFAAATIVVSISAATSAPLDWVKDQEEMSAISQLAAGYAWASICDRKVDMSVAAKYLHAQLGDDRSYNADQVADLMFLVVGTIGLEQQIAGGKRGCPTARRSFGPRGSVIPGLFD